MKIIDDLTEAFIGDNRDLYQAVFRGQILSPRALIPDDIADEHLLELKIYKTRRKYSIAHHQQINCAHSNFLTFLFSAVQTNDNEGNVYIGRTRPMDSNKQMASNLNKWLNETQNNCMCRRL